MTAAGLGSCSVPFPLIGFYRVSVELVRSDYYAAPPVTTGTITLNL